jgi:hypothetical protein
MQTTISIAGDDREQNHQHRGLERSRTPGGLAKIVKKDVPVFGPGCHLLDAQSSRQAAFPGHPLLQRLEQDPKADRCADPARLTPRVALGVAQILLFFLHLDKQILISCVQSLSLFQEQWSSVG